MQEGGKEREGGRGHSHLGYREAGLLTTGIAEIREISHMHEVEFHCAVIEHAAVLQQC